MLIKMLLGKKKKEDEWLVPFFLWVFWACLLFALTVLVTIL